MEFWLQNRPNLQPKVHDRRETGARVSQAQGRMVGVGILDRFSPATRAWFEASFSQPTPAQAQAWDAIADGKDTLVVAPTGSGKTLAAFLWSIDQIASKPTPEPKKRLTTLYISPLKALGVDVERNLT